MIRSLFLVLLAVALRGTTADLYYKNWDIWAKVADTDKVHFKIALKHADYTEAFMRPLLYRLVDPRSELYGQYLSAQETIDLFTPHQDRRDPVMAWLKNAGFTLLPPSSWNHLGKPKNHCMDYGDSFDCYAEARMANELFDVEYYWYLHRNYRSQEGFRYLVARALTDYTLPAWAHEHIQFVEGVSYLPRVEAFEYPKPFNGPGADPGYVGTEVMDRLYALTSHTVSENVSLASIEFQGGGFNQTRLQITEKMNGLPVTKVYKVLGGNQGGGIESMLDMQMEAILVTGEKQWYINYDLWIYQFFSDLATREEVPTIVSVSYGWAEWDQCTIMQCNNITAAEYINRCNLEAMKLAFRGITVCVASGDAGSPGRTNEQCLSSNSTSPTQERNINPVFPGSSPYVTSVGATFVKVTPNNTFKYTTEMCQKYGCANGTTTQTVSQDQVGWTSGGGFSVYASESQPPYQGDVVQQYLTSGVKLPNMTQWNPHGRGYPDVTANGHNCPVYGMGEDYGSVDGTSCSSPTFASLLALANDHQLKKGCPRLGFVNPTLYLAAQTPKGGFSQPATVTNTHCTEYQCCSDEYGFSAPPKPTTWNPVSGLGELNLDQFLQFLDTLPCPDEYPGVVFETLRLMYQEIHQFE